MIEEMSFRRRSVQSSFFVTLVALGSLVLVAGCPSDCTCKWKGGKQTVECVDRGLRTFPSPIDSGTQVLDLSGNSFETLPPDHFSRYKLTNLQKIYLSRCRLTNVNSKAFRELTNLVELDLSNNLLREIPQLSDCHGLMKLILNGNTVPKITRGAFMGLDSLTTLEISHCGTEIIEKGAFDGLTSLEWLKLNGNKIRSMSAKGILPIALKGISLEDNPFICDCHLVDLRIWLGERNVANSAEPRCSKPDRLTNATLKELSLDNFACLPQLSPTSTYQKIGEGKNVTFVCRISAVPEATVEWMFKGEMISNFSSNMIIDTYYPTHSSYAFTPPYHGQSTVTATSPLEKKSELSILNITIDEHGTYICFARNRAGAATANFTVKVLSREDPELSSSSVISISENVTSLVNNYPNLVIIIISGVAVIGFVITLCVIIACICRCSRICRCRRGRSSPRSASTEAGLRGKNTLTHGDHQEKDGNKNSNSLGLGIISGHGGGHGGSVDGNKDLRRINNDHVNNTMNHGNPHGKSNGSVFLLSGNSVDIGDSNPDLIEGVDIGVKRADGDGHETCYSHHGGNHNHGGFVNNSSNTTNDHSQMTHSVGSQHPPIQHPSPSQKQQILVPSSPGINSANVIEPYMDLYGLPHHQHHHQHRNLGGGLNVSTLPLIRRSNSTNTQLPLNYDLAKYPKEYISQSPLRNIPIPPPQGYYEDSSQQMGIYTQQPGTSHNYNSAPSYIIPQHHQNYLYQHQQQHQQQSNPGDHHNIYGTMTRYSVHHHDLPLSSGSGGSCACAPIIEDDEEKCDDDGVNRNSLPLSLPPPAPPLSTHPAHMNNTIKSPKASSSSSVNSPVGKKLLNKSTGTNAPPPVVKRLQRQIKSSVHESPDEGYDDGSAEGTEI